MSTLMKPLFVDGNFNRAGTRIRAEFVKELPTVRGAVRLWRHSGVPENKYPVADTDLYYIFAEVGEYLVPIGLTEYTLEKRTSQRAIIDKHFKGETNAYWEQWHECKTAEQREAFKQKYDALAAEYGADVVLQGEYVWEMLRLKEAAWRESKTNEHRFPNCIGAAVCGELDEWLKVSAAYKSRKEVEERAEAEERAAQEAAEQKEQEAREKAEIDAYMALLRKAGRVADGKMAVKVADALGVKIPLRTRGFMLEKLAAFYVEQDGHVERMEYYRMGGRKYTGVGVYNTLTDICMAAREKVCA